MKKRTKALTAITALAVVAATGTLVARSEQVSPAPSGNEQSFVEVGPDGHAIATPGTDSPVDVSGDGHTTYLDFDKGEIGDANSVTDLPEEDATVEYEDSTDSPSQDAGSGNNGSDGDQGNSSTGTDPGQDSGSEYGAGSDAASESGSDEGGESSGGEGAGGEGGPDGGGDGPDVGAAAE